MSFWSKLFGKKKSMPQEKTTIPTKAKSTASPKTTTPPPNTKAPLIPSNQKSMFLLGWEATFNGNEQCQDFMKAHRSTEVNAKSVYFGIELVFEEEKLIKAFDYRDGKKQDRPLNESEIGLPFVDYRTNPILKLFENSEGVHQLGGAIPEDVNFPDHNCISSFQYLGYLSNEDENLAWLPFPIHMMCPIYLDIGEVFLDYSNPNKPTLINRDQVEKCGTAYPDLKKDSEIIYNSKKFDLVPFDDFDPPLNAGVPNWVQYPTFPKCPKSGKNMRFLCQIEGGVKTSFHNVEPKEEFYRQYFEGMNFWGDGYLYVFVQPEEKTVCYFIQNT